MLLRAWQLRCPIDDEESSTRQRNWLLSAEGYWQSEIKKGLIFQKTSSLHSVEEVRWPSGLMALLPPGQLASLTFLGWDNNISDISRLGKVSNAAVGVAATLSN